MTESLKNAFTLVSRLSDLDQDVIAAWLIAELDSERKWDTLFRDSQDVLANLAILPEEIRAQANRMRAVHA